MAADETRAKIRAWIEDIEAKFHVSRAEIAAKAGVHHATIYRWFDENSTFTPSMRTIARIASAFGVPTPGDGPRPTGFGESDLSPYIAAPAELAPSTTNQFVRAVTSRALELAGYMPGDLLLIDQSLAAVAGDAVCAQVYNLSRGTAETKLRIFEPPFITTRSMDPAVAEKPLYVDGERVVIAGVVLRSLRQRAA